MRMIRLFLATFCIIATSFVARSQAPGVDPRGILAYSAPIIIGVVEEPSRMVFWPDRVAKSVSVKALPDGTYIVELPQRRLDHIKGYLFRVRIEEVLKSDQRVRASTTIEIFAPFKLEGGVFLPGKQRFLLALAPFTPKSEDFEKTLVINAGQSLSQRGPSFDLRRRYYVVAGEANGAVPITDKNRGLILEIRARIRNH